MDLDSLRTFLAITETGSFTSAGHRVGRTQSAVSQQIRKMEDRLGQPLLERRGGAVSLTEGGRVLLPYAREMLNLEDQVLGELAQERAGSGPSNSKRPRSSSSKSSSWDLVRPRYVEGSGYRGKIRTKSTVIAYES